MGHDYLAARDHAANDDHTIHANHAHREEVSDDHHSAQADYERCPGDHDDTPNSHSAP